MSRLDIRMSVPTMLVLFYESLPNILRIDFLFLCLLLPSSRPYPRMMLDAFLILTDMRMYKYIITRNGSRKKIREDISSNGDCVSNIAQKAD